ncbi:MAG: hypothetical protein HKN25_13455 [Pyrinomonadaceae bacterium]|nr:hypothetical protein [Pyrinomonadaceae bacterium]
MKQNYISVPFKAESGITEYNGVAKFSAAGIIFEFEGKYFGLIGEEVKEVRVALEEILDIRFRKGIFKLFTRIHLRLKSFTKLSELPNEGGKIKLNIKRRDFELAQKAVEDTLQYLSGVDKSALDTENETNEQLPPPKTSVNELFDTEKLQKENPRETSKLSKDS